MIISREELYKAPEIDGKTFCADILGCEVLNEILNGTPEPRQFFPFKIDSSAHSITVTISTIRMAPKEMMDLNLKLMEFLTTEIYDIRNGD
jgi:hypothetical protein